MLENKLRSHLYWKARLSARSNGSQSRSTYVGHNRHGDEELNPALKKKDRDRAERGATRRRVRGGASATVSVPSQGQDSIPPLPRGEESIFAEL
jgi:DNA excision repair protein ERCC-4